MKRELYLTADGSHTIAIPEWKATYHSTHGAIQESRHVFIQVGLHHVLSNPGIPSENRIHILEMGFGTGLNALLSLQEAISSNRPLFYQGVELYPLLKEESERLNYADQLQDPVLNKAFCLLHSAPWNKEIVIHPLFTLMKSPVSITHLVVGRLFHIIYYDAFAPDVQPELWEPVLFDKLYHLLYPGGVLVTYCCKGKVRRDLQTAGFKVEKLSGPPGKREILRAIKMV